MKALLVIAMAMGILAARAGDRDQPDAPVRVPLNHFFLVVDSATYAGIDNSDLLKNEFAAFERRTTVRADRTYTGIYFYGANTYFEFFDASTERDRKVGDSGIAFGVDEAGSVQRLSERLPGSMLFPITRKLGDNQVPWFIQLTPKEFGQGAPLTSWIMEYDPRFLAEWNASATKDRGVTRREILDRYRAVLKNVPSSPCLEDVTGLTVALDSDYTAGLIGFCKALGYTESRDARAVFLKGSDFLLSVVPASPGAHGIQRVTFKVNRRPRGGRTEFRFGSKSVLRFHGSGRATWTF